MKLDLKTTDLDDIVRLYAMQEHVVEHPKLFEPFFGERESES